MAIEKTFQCKKLLQNNIWLDDQHITVDENGIITSLEKKNDFTCLDEWILPGFQNSHSHAFQFAMAGLAEHLPSATKGDDFWSWRSAMYDLALRVSPDQLQDIAAMLYVQMMRHGITQVVEFHYLHHDKNGQPYDNISEMGERLVAAAKQAGIAITLVPIFYQRGGFNQPAEDHQKRFLSKDGNSYGKLFESSTKSCEGYFRANVGVGIHSLRAVAGEEIITTLANFPGLPVHIHIAEQQKEVDDCLKNHNKEPITWLLDNTNVGRDFHLVHATHMADGSCERLAKTSASVIVCPSTEGNLGDGFFRLQEFRHFGGKVSIGTDSNIQLSPMEDLRWLDYAQRLKSETRNIFCTQGGQDSGSEIFREAWQTGRATAGMPSQNYFEVGSHFDGICLNIDAPIFIGKPDERILSCLIYGGDSSCIKATITAGKMMVADYIHFNNDEILANYKATMSALLGS